MNEERVIVVDINVEQWTVGEARAYRDAVGVNPEYALGVLQNAVNESRADAVKEFGDACFEEGWKPPAGWAPLRMLNVDPAYLLGFAWIAARRADPSVTYTALENELPVGDLSEAFYAALSATIEAATPLANRAERRARGRGPRTTTASPSRASSAGRSRKSTP